MFSKVFLAQTEQEMAQYLPERSAYMALHFSPYNQGLSNIPKMLPKGCLILLDDSMPPETHAPEQITAQLIDLVEQFAPSGVLLDFQQPVTGKLRTIAEKLVHSLPCPVGVTENYAKDLNCPVFLPPVPVNISLRDYLAPWKNRGIYLEIAPEGCKFTVTETGSKKTPIPIISPLPLKDSNAHCHYNVEVLDDRAIFTVCRYKEDLSALVKDATKLGVLACVGLYAELS